MPGSAGSSRRCLWPRLLPPPALRWGPAPRRRQRGQGAATPPRGGHGAAPGLRLRRLRGRLLRSLPRLCGIPKVFVRRILALTESATEREGVDHNVVRAGTQGVAASPFSYCILTNDLELPRDSRIGQLVVSSPVNRVLLFLFFFLFVCLFLAWRRFFLLMLTPMKVRGRSGKHEVN